MKFCVIGLGRFGYQVATELSENGMEVLAIDKNESIVASIKDAVAHAITMKVTDEAGLRSLGVDEIETVIVAMGENTSESILLTVLLKKHLQVPYVVARAIDDVNKEVLRLVGADLVVLPEKEIGSHLADKLSSPFADVIRLSKNFSISYCTAPKTFINRSLKELNLHKSFNINCIGKQNEQEETITILAPEYIITQNDKLIFAGADRDLEQLAKL